ncbi:hypothetical protein [Amphritea sp. HPY]|uniref:hypothetical protein n=1 Tax=Amphritea sp. HPY TaxID=3421652 RepID=UPI003D7DD01F
MASVHWIILAVIVMAGLAYWNHQRTDAQLKVLKDGGFVVSDQLAGNPKLLVSSSQKQLAVVFPDSYLRADFGQVSGLELRHDSNAQTEFNYRLQITLKSGSQSGRQNSVEVAYENEARAQSALKKLQQYLNN